MELLNQDRQKELLAQPESGMGYQTVEVVLRGGENLRGTVFNTNVLVYSDEPEDRLKSLIETSRRSQMLEQSEVGSGEEIVEVRVIPSEDRPVNRVRESSGAPTTSIGANQAVQEGSQAHEQFKRFSAFVNDHRVTSTGGLSPGSFATTAADAVQVHTGRDAVVRYALPNPTPAVHVFTINPPVQTTLQRGTAQPAYGQPGGGAEVTFVNGSPNNTVAGPVQIPP